MNAKEFREELLKIMPGYSWTVHRSTNDTVLKATGIQSSGFNRLSTLQVKRMAVGAMTPTYEAKSAGHGTRAKWLHTNTDGTLARALRGLQDHYEYVSNTYRSHAVALKKGRIAPIAEKELPYQCDACSTPGYGADAACHCSPAPAAVSRGADDV